MFSVLFAGYFFFSNGIFLGSFFNVLTPRTQLFVVLFFFFDVFVLFSFVFLKWYYDTMILFGKAVY